jgi:RNA polymerase sigma factor (sigma-70 family)
MLRVDPLRNPEPLMRRVYAYVAYRIGEGADAEDVTADTFERAFRYRKSFDPSRGEPIGWLLGIARRCIDDFFNQRPELVDDPPELVAPGNLEEDTARRLRLAAVMGVLSERERDLIALRYGADLTTPEIGRLLGLQQGAVRVALHRALQRLRAALEEATASAPPPTARAL